MKAKILLDTVILIDHLNGIPKAIRWVQSLVEGEALVSVVTRAEVLAGCKSEEEISVTRLFLSLFPCLGLDSATADIAGEVRRKSSIKLPDAFQAALAIQHNLKLATRNTKDFNNREYPFILIPYRT